MVKKSLKMNLIIITEIYFNCDQIFDRVNVEVLYSNRALTVSLKETSYSD